MKNKMVIPCKQSFFIIITGILFQISVIFFVQLEPGCQKAFTVLLIKLIILVHESSPLDDKHLLQQLNKQKGDNTAHNPHINCAHRTFGSFFFFFLVSFTEEAMGVLFKYWAKGDVSGTCTIVYKRSNVSHLSKKNGNDWLAAERSLNKGVSQEW